MNQELVVIDEVAGAMQAEILKGMLAAQGIEAALSEESAALVYGITIPAFGRVQLLVRSENAEQARQLLDEYYKGEIPPPEAGEGDADDPSDDEASDDEASDDEASG